MEVEEWILVGTLLFPIILGVILYFRIQYSTFTPNEKEGTSMKSESETAVEEYINDRKKSYFSAFILALFFGPLGLFYTEVLVPLLLLVALIFLTPFIPFIALGIWLFSIILAFPGVTEYNKKLESEARLMSLR